MPIEKIVEFPLEMLEKILLFCDKKSLINFASCSSWCNCLVAPILFEDIKIKYYQIKKVQSLLSGNSLRFTKCLTFSGSGSDGSLDWGNVARNFVSVINSCDHLKVKELSIVENAIFGSDLLQISSKLVNLKSIHLSECKEITKFAFICMSNLKFLKKLTLNKCDILGNDFSNLLGLSELNITECTVHEACLEYITQMVSLKKLSLTENKVKFEFNINYNIKKRLKLDLEKLKNLVLLEYLDVSYSISSVDEFDILSLVNSLKSLKELDVSSVSLLYLTSNCHSSTLTSLLMNQCDINDDELALVKNLKNLQFLSVSNETTDEGLEHISHVVSLVDLDIACNMITDEGIKQLASLTSLVKINLYGCYDLSDTSLIYLSVLPSLKYLECESNSFNEEALYETSKSKGWTLDTW